MNELLHFHTSVDMVLDAKLEHLSRLNANHNKVSIAKVHNQCHCMAENFAAKWLKSPCDHAIQCVVLEKAALASQYQQMIENHS